MKASGERWRKWVKGGKREENAGNHRILGAIRHTKSLCTFFYKKNHGQNHGIAFQLPPRDWIGDVVTLKQCVSIGNSGICTPCIWPNSIMFVQKSQEHGSRGFPLDSYFLMAEAFHLLSSGHSSSVGQLVKVPFAGQTFPWYTELDCTN